MNSEQLNKINDLRIRLSKIRNFLPFCRKRAIKILKAKRKKDYYAIEAGENYYIYLNSDILEPALIDYCKKLEAELKELGYED